MVRIIIAAGGSGGHVFPALEVAQELRKNNHNILFLTTPGIAQKIIEQKGFLIVCLKARGFTLGSPVACIRAVAAMMHALYQSFLELKKYKPNAVVGFGGYVAFPVILAARCMKIPTLIHEQNVVPGRANVLLARITNRIAVSFEHSMKYFNKKKTVVTGCPCHCAVPEMSRKDIIKKFNLDTQRPVVLVLGGSQGSRRINEEFLKAASLLQSTLEFQIIHITGRRDYHDCRKKYQDIKVPYCILDFLDDIESAYSVADCVISRAGAVTIMELIAFRLNAIIIPYPYAGGHQLQNAMVLRDMCLANIVEEKDLTDELLCVQIQKILKSENKQQLSGHEAYKMYFPDAAVRIVHEIIGLKR